MYIIFHSDDTGATPSITTRILDAWKSRLIQGFSIFANGNSLSEIKDTLDSNPDITARLVVHLNLSEGEPVLPPDEIPELVDESGHFKVGFLGLLVRYTVGSGQFKRAIENQVEREWRAQIKKVTQLCKPRTLSGVDGHVHIHMIPFLFRIAVKLAKEFGIPEIRMCREPFYLSPKLSECLSISFLVNILKHIVLQVCANKDEKIAQKRRINHPDAMLGVLYSGIMNDKNIRSGIKAAESTNVDKFEVLIHIGKASENELDRWKGDRKKAAFALSPSRDIEYFSLLNLRKDY